MKKAGLFLAGALLGAAAFAGPVAVKAAKPEKVSEGDSRVIVGRVEGSSKVDLTARIVGTLWESNGEEGQRVKKGDVLYRIEDTIYKANLRTAKAELAELEAKLAQAEIDAERYTEGETKGGVSKTDRDRVILARDVALAKVDAAKAKVTLSENDLSYCTIVSPVDGILGKDATEVGNTVGPFRGVLRDVICSDPIDVSVAAPEPVVLQAFGRGGEMRENYRLRLLRADGQESKIVLKPYAFDNKVDSATGTVLIRFRGANPDGELRHGGYVKLVLNEVYAAPKLAIPMSAVVFEGDRRFVYVVANAKAAKREVKLGEMLGDRVLVEGGLAAEETFVTTGTHKLFDGADVKEL